MRTGEHIVVIGSGLGCLCHFAAALLRLPCIGYDILAESCVAEAQRIAWSHNIFQEAVVFHAESGVVADVQCAGICWINDYAFSQTIRVELLSKLARELPAGALVVTYRPKPDNVEGLELVDVVVAEATWRREQKHYLLVK